MSDPGFVEDDDLEDEPRTFEDRLLAHVERQTKALESMQTIMWAWSAVAVIVLVIVVIVWIRNTV